MQEPSSNGTYLTTEELAELIKYDARTKSSPEFAVNCFGQWMTFPEWVKLSA